MGFLVGFLEKGTKSANLGNFGVLCRGVRILHRSVGPHQGMACPRLGVTKRELGQASGTPRRSKAMPRQSKAMPRQRPTPQLSNAKPWRRPTPQRSSATPWRSTVHRRVFLSCFSIPLFRGLVYWTNEDLISE